MKSQTLLIFFLISFFCISQNTIFNGVPFIKNYLPNQYQNKGKVWNIDFSSNGMMYFASDKALLEFDGKKWNTYKGSKGYIRAIKVLNDSVIYTGSDLDFGVWKKNNTNQFTYKSLYPKNKSNKFLNEQFWNVHINKNKIVFVSFDNTYILDGNKTLKIPAITKFTKSYFLEEKMYLFDQENGLFVLENSKLKRIFKLPKDKNINIVGIYSLMNKLYFVTENEGIYSYSNGIFSEVEFAIKNELKQHNVFSFYCIDKKYLVFGTILNGIYVTDVYGNKIYHINKKNGLVNNTALSLNFSSNGKLWSGLDYGIASINLFDNFSFFFDYDGKFGTGYTALLDKNTFYLGTNQGLYQTDWNNFYKSSSENNFELINNSKGQVWEISKIRDTIYLAHDKGLFYLNTNENSLKKISLESGILSLTPYKEKFLLAGNYNGIYVFKKQNKNWIKFKSIPLIYGSCKQLIFDNNHILWVSIPNYGIIRAELDDKFNPKSRSIFLEDIFLGENPTIKKEKDKIYVLTSLGKYEYDNLKKSFTYKNYINKSFHIPNNQVYNSSSVAINSSVQFHSINNGFILENIHNFRKQKTSSEKLILRKITANNNDEKQMFSEFSQIPYKLNNINLEVIIPNVDNVMYRFKNNKKWSSWSEDNSFELLNLKEGNYSILIQANTNNKIIEKQFNFSISPPCFRTWYAYIFYILLGIGIIYLVLKIQKIKLKKQKKELLLRQKISLNEQSQKYKEEIFRQEQELLINQLKNKTVELANKAKADEDKNRLLITLKEKISDAQLNPSLSKFKWNEIQKILDSYLKVETNTFEIQIDELHQDFFKLLKLRFPSLSVYDMRLCIYLKIGLNSNEIAEILNVQPSSIYISRSRLRKKLKLTAEEDLHSFLNNLK